MFYFVLFYLFVSRASGLTEEDCIQEDQIQKCYTLHGSLLAGITNDTNICQSAKKYVECVERAACICNQTTDSTVGTALTYTYGLYSVRDCQSVAGPLPVRQGIECRDNSTNTTTPGAMAALAVADSMLVAGLEQTCPGFRDCYVIYDSEASLALHHRNLSSLCSVLEETLKCFQKAACTCGKTNHPDIAGDIDYNRNVYMSTCSVIKDTSKLKRLTCQYNETRKWMNSLSCEDSNPLYGCFTKFKWDLTTAKADVILRCKAYKAYMECVEEVACVCGMIRNAMVYRSLANFASHYSKEQCDTLTESLQLIPGMKCPNGTGTNDEEDRLILTLAESSNVVSENEKCPGLKPCYAALDEQLGKALFNKNLLSVCLAQKTYVECLERVFCNCGTLHSSNVTEFLHFQRQTHQATCLEDAPIEAVYKCEPSSSSAGLCGLFTSLFISTAVLLLLMVV